MADIITLEGQGELQGLGIKVRYSLVISSPPGLPHKRMGRGRIESVTNEALPQFTPNQGFILILDDGSEAKIQMEGTSNTFSMLAT